MKMIIGTMVRGACLARVLMMAAALLVLAGGTVANATEGGGGAYPNGAEDFMSGAVPPPGTYFINYLEYYSADKFVGNSGSSVVPDFDLKVTAEVLRFIHVTDTKILGGFWGMHIFLPFLYVDVEAAGASKSKGGLGDIIIDPFILSWHGKNWHAATGIDIYLPTGAYNRGFNANLGRNYWTFEPILAGTYVSDGGFEASAKLMYDFNTNNNASGYHSGQEFHTDFALSQKVGNFRLGAAGYYYQQVTDDKFHGDEIEDFRGRVIAIGPALKYDYKNMAFSLKYQFETAVRNRPEGDNLWFKFTYAF
jgi:hypothetical protein